MKILVIRFSSFGDVVQALSIPSHIKSKFPASEIHWLTREEFTPLLESHPHIKKAWGLQRKSGFRGLHQMAGLLAQEKFDRVYDAHNNLRSHWVTSILFWRHLLAADKPPQVLRRSLERFRRFLLLQFHRNFFEMPFSGQRDMLKPLEAWGIPFRLPMAPQLFLNAPVGTNLIIQDDNAFQPTKDLKVGNHPYVALAPSAAFELKRWPIDYWKVLVQRTSYHFVILGGPEDQFTEQIAKVAPERTINLAGKLSLLESSLVVKNAQALVANDTGLLHVGEQLGIPTIALMGPAPFGFPSRVDKTIILETELPCRPCSKHGQGRCRNVIHQKCLRDIKPELVARHLEALLTNRISPLGNSL